MKIGTYAVEQDYSRYVTQSAKTTLAIIGTATKGDPNVATLCTSAQDFVNKFGPLDPDHLATYAAQYFLSQSSRLYFIRVLPSAIIEGNDRELAKEAILEIHGQTPEGTDLGKILTISALEKGTYANGYSIKLEAVQTGSTYAYTLTLMEKAGIPIEIIKNISLDNLTVGYTSNYMKITSRESTPNGFENLTPGVYYFDGGSDGDIDKITPEEYEAAASAILADAVDANIITVPGVSNYDVINKVLILAEQKGDCIYLIDPPKGVTKEGIVDWRNRTGAYANPAQPALDSSYGALYYDWCTIYDSVNKIAVDVPPSVVVAATYAYSDRLADVWYAPAGLTRGVVRGVMSTLTKLSKRDTENLYNNGINPIYEDPQVGLVLWGQKTLLKENTSLNRVNVRRLLNYLKRVVTSACNYLTFDPNDRITWNSFQMKVEPVLQHIQSNRGIYEYRIIKGETIVTDEDIDNYRMPCMVIVRPTKAAEEIPIYFTITNTGADFNEVIDSASLFTGDSLITF